MTDRTCQWPIGDPRHPDFHKCERKLPDGWSLRSAYCPQHEAMARNMPIAPVPVEGAIGKDKWTKREGGSDG